MTSFIDTHCHLDMLKVDVPTALEKAAHANVQTLLTICVEPQNFEFLQDITQQHDHVYGSLGVHPHEAAQYDSHVEQYIQEHAPQNTKIVAIGETGLDYHYSFADKETQHYAFQQQLKLAEALQLPVVLHTREAEEDTLSLLEQTPPSKKGVAHSFTSSQEMAHALIEMGWFIGINGIVTFKNAQDLRDVVQQIPLDRLLLETDAPFLTPVPFRGKPNDSSMIPVIAKFIAELRDIPIEQLAEQTNENARQLFLTSS